MFQHRTERGLKGSYLILEEQGDEDSVVKEPFEMRMMSQNRIRGLLKQEKRTNDGRRQYVYDITSYTSLRELYNDREMHYEDVLRILGALSSERKILEDYLLSEGHLLLGPDYIFIHNENNIPIFCYYALSDKEIGDSLEELAAFFLQRTDHSDSTAVSLVYDLYRRVAAGDYAFENLLYREYEQPDDEVSNIDEKDESELCNDDWEPDESELSDACTPKGFVGKVIFLIMSVIGMTVLILGGDLAGIPEKLRLALISLFGGIALYIPVYSVLSSRMLRLRQGPNNH